MTREEQIKNIFKKIANFFRCKSPCCKKPMTSCYEMNLDKLLYECPKCHKEWI